MVGRPLTYIGRRDPLECELCWVMCWRGRCWIVCSASEENSAPDVWLSDNITEVMHWIRALRSKPRQHPPASVATIHQHRRSRHRHQSAADIGQQVKICKTAESFPVYSVKLSSWHQRTQANKLTKVPDIFSWAYLVFNVFSALINAMPRNPSLIRQAKASPTL